MSTTLSSFFMREYQRLLNAKMNAALTGRATGRAIIMDDIVDQATPSYNFADYEMLRLQHGHFAFRPKTSNRFTATYQCSAAEAENRFRALLIARRLGANP